MSDMMITISMQIFEDMADRIEELEAKLERAEDFVRRLERFAVQNKDGFLTEKAQEALAELTGGDDDRV